MKEIGNNGRLATFLVMIIGYIVYYGYLFPFLASRNQELFWFQRDIPQKSDSQSAPTTSTRCIYVSVRVSKYMTDYLDGKIIVTIINISDNKSCKGAIIIGGELRGEQETLSKYPIFRVLDEEKEPTSFARNLVLPYDLKPRDSLNVPIRVNIPDRRAEEIEFTFYNVNNVNQDNWALDPLSFGGSPTCLRDKNSQNEQPLPRICASIDSDGAVKQSAIENLLLPPWSNGILPLVIIAFIWLAENSMPQRFKVDAQRSDSFAPSKVIIISLVTLSLLLVFVVEIRILFLSKAPIGLAMILPVSIAILVFVLTKLDAKQPAEEDQIVKGLEDRVVGLEKRAEHLDARIDDITSRLAHLETYCMEIKKNNLIS